jgi:hypothetical protein
LCDRAKKLIETEARQPSYDTEVFMVTNNSGDVVTDVRQWRPIDGDSGMPELTRRLPALTSASLRYEHFGGTQSWLGRTLLSPYS